jgi:UDP-N-acetylmuramoylalanine--D-glutamate ligase
MADARIQRSSVLQDLKGIDALVMGLGRFGGGIGVSRFLVGQGARVSITDQADESALAGSIEKLRDLDITYQLGGHDASALDRCDLLVVSPAVDKARSEFFQAAVGRGIRWTSEVNLFLERCPARIIGVTGTAGKSTTAAMIYGIMSGAMGSDSVWLGGNIGRSLLEELPRMREDHWVVLELSSFQLADVESVGWSPHISLVTHITAHHLDRHGTVEAYREAKRNIVRFQGAGDVAFLPSGDEALAGWSEGHGGEIVYWDRDESARAALEDGDVRVPGAHNLRNALAASSVCLAAGVPAEKIAGGLRAFEGLPHRLESVREYQGVRYVNDSKATTPEATMMALRAFGEPPIVLVGGYEKGVALEELASALIERARAVICFGQSRARVGMSIRRRGDAGRNLKVRSVHDFGGGVNLARRMARDGDVVLLSPGFASYDEFANYEERGDAFKKQVQGWI